MDNKRGFYFETEKGNIYYYNDITGQVKGSKQKPKETICYGTEKYIPTQITAEAVEKELEMRGYDQLTLIVTQGCNIRCKYCVYSGQYENSREHNNINMDFDTAKKALLLYFGYVKKKKMKIPLFVPEISFYGGEPLVNFELIRQSVEFIKIIYDGKVDYNITTNACLLDDEKIKFFAENKFILSISLNGNKNEHDRLRVFANGEGTYEYAMSAIKKIRNIYPEYFKEFCYVIGVYDHGTDLEEIEEFFEREEILKDKLLLYVPVIDYGTRWYEQYSEEERKKFLNQYQQIKKKYIQNLKLGKKESQIQKALFHMGDLQIINRPMNCTIQEVTNGLLPSFGACIPGHKMAIDPYGVIHACEKVNDKMPLGTVDSGLDYGKIAKILEKYNNTMGEQCINCPIRRFCPHCYQALLDGEGNFSLTKLKPCNFYIQARINQMIQTYDMLEAHVSPDTLLYGG